MDKSKTPIQDMNEMMAQDMTMLAQDMAMIAQDMEATMAQGVEQARGAMENYYKFFHKNMSASLWVGRELNKKLTEYAQQNIATALELSQELMQAKHLKDIARVQSEFFQAHGCNGHR